MVDLPTARGVAGAVVTASGELDIGSMPAPPGRLSTTSGETGEFLLQGLKPGVIRLVASTPDRTTRAATLVPVSLGDELAGVEVWVDVLEPPRDAGALAPIASSARPRDAAARGVVSGLVTDGHARVAANVWVTARADDGSRVESEALTGQDGTFVLGNLADGPYRVSAYGLTTTGRATQTGVSPGDHLTLALGGLATVVLRVHRGERAVSDFDVTLTGPTSRREHIEDADGECRLRWLDPGSYAIRVVAGAESWSQTLVVRPDAVEQRAVSLSVSSLSPP